MELQGSCLPSQPSHRETPAHHPSNCQCDIAAALSQKTATLHFLELLATAVAMKLRTAKKEKQRQHSANARLDCLQVAMTQPLAAADLCMVTTRPRASTDALTHEWQPVVLTDVTLTRGNPESCQSTRPLADCICPDATSHTVLAPGALAHGRAL